MNRIEIIAQCHSVTFSYDFVMNVKLYDKISNIAFLYNKNTY